MTLRGATVTSRRQHRKGRVAQLVEQGIENPRVGGSTPSPATSTFLSLSLLALVAAGCGDRCEVLCQQTATRLQQCGIDGQLNLTWNDLGARGRVNFVDECRDDWDRARLALSASDLAVALEVCDDTLLELPDISCEELVALYAPVP